MGTMSTPITWVDAFSDAPFAGNPAAVCLLHGDVSDAYMQSVAFELGIAETAFLTPTDDPAAFGLRWFTPATEVDLCGHATLASAHALRQGGTVDGSSAVTFRTRSGELIATFEDDLIVLDFPADPVTPAPLPSALAGQWSPGSVVTSGRTEFFTFVVLNSAETVRDYPPDLAAIAAAPSRALLLTAAAVPGTGADFVLRVFGPNVGIDEDPATGSAQCTAGPYWAEALGLSELTAHQLSTRGAVLHVRPDGSRVHIAGHAATVLTGHLC